MKKNEQLKSVTAEDLLNVVGGRFGEVEGGPGTIETFQGGKQVKDTIGGTKSPNPDDGEKAGLPKLIHF